MIARVIVFNQQGKKTAHQLGLHHTGTGALELKLVMDTETEHFAPWLFFFLRDHGAYIETTDPVAVAAALNLSPGEQGIFKVNA